MKTAGRYTGNFCYLLVFYGPGLAQPPAPQTHGPAPTATKTTAAWPHLWQSALFAADPDHVVARLTPVSIIQTGIANSFDERPPQRL